MNRQVRQFHPWADTRPMVQSASFSLQQYGQRVCAQVDRALADYADLGPGCPERLANAIRYSLLAPGKRLRPMLAILASESCGGPLEAALPAACAVEMIHAYSLIHDDLPAMDDDDLRRGRPSCHKQFDEATAILAGDALQALAFEVLARDVQPSAVAARCCATLAYAAGAQALVGGQADDLAGENLPGTIEQLESIHRRKTGALFLASLALGAYTAGATDEQEAALAQYGQRLGLAFQITDDVLDVRGTSDRLGKSTGKDHQQGKLTFPALLGMDESMRRAELLVGEACAALAPFGSAAQGLEALAHYVLERNH